MYGVYKFFDKYIYIYKKKRLIQKCNVDFFNFDYEFILKRKRNRKFLFKIMSSIFFSFLFFIDDWEILFIFYFRYETAAILVNLSIFCTCTIALKGTTAFVSRVHNMMKNQRKKQRYPRQRVISLCERYSVIYDSLSLEFLHAKL